MNRNRKISHEQLREELLNGSTAKEIAAKYDMSERVVRIRKAKLKATGFDPENDRHHKNPEDQIASGYSTLVRLKNRDDDSEGVVMEWVKTSVDKQKQEEAMQQVVSALCEQLPRHESTPPPVHTNSDLLNCYVISDYHLGMMAWGEESGADWDLKIAESTLIKWFEQSIKLAPDSETAIFCNLSDMLHWDGLEAVTPANKHVLDADTRFQKVVRVCIRLFRQIIDMLLEKHKHVILINAGGNHDPASTVWLREMFAAFYGDNERVTVDDTADLYCCYEHGETSLFFHHGHKRRMSNIDSVFAAKFREVFGRTRHSYAHMGHLHHVDVKETNLMIIEQHRTLAAPDAYAAAGGWMSGRDAKVITYHKRYGEVGRVVVGIDMISE